MKRLLVTLALSVAAGAASAADMAVKAPPAVAIAEYNWPGFYGGLSGEWIHSENSWRFANPGPPTLTPSTTTQDQAGIGLDYVAYKGVLADLILGLDYRHVDLGNQYQASSLDAFRAVPPNANGRNVGGTSDVVRTSIILKSHGWRMFGARM